MLQPVGEEHPVGQAGQRVVERLVGQLPLELAALGHVAQGDDQAGDGLVGAQVAAVHLQQHFGTPAADGPEVQPFLRTLAAPDRGEHLGEPDPVAGVDHVGQRARRSGRRRGRARRDGLA